MKTGEKIGELAKNKGISLRQLAVKADVPYNTLYAMVNRGSMNIEKSTLKKIIAALDVSIADFFEMGPDDKIQVNKIEDSRDKIEKELAEACSADMNDEGNIQTKKLQLRELEDMLDREISLAMARMYYYETAKAVTCRGTKKGAIQKEEPYDFGKNQWSAYQNSVFPFMMKAFKQAESTVEQTNVLKELLAATAEMAGHAMAETFYSRAGMKMQGGEDSGIPVLLDAYSCLNAEGRKEAIKYIQRLQYVPEYKGQPE